MAFSFLLETIFGLIYLKNINPKETAITTRINGRIILNSSFEALLEYFTLLILYPQYEQNSAPSDISLPQFGQ